MLDDERVFYNMLPSLSLDEQQWVKDTRAEQTKLGQKALDWLRENTDYDVPDHLPALYPFPPSRPLEFMRASGGSTFDTVAASFDARGQDGFIIIGDMVPRFGHTAVQQQSVIFHELVHYVQYKNGKMDKMPFVNCAAIELEAYTLQSKWLEEQGEKPWLSEQGFARLKADAERWEKETAV